MPSIADPVQSKYALIIAVNIVRVFKNLTSNVPRVSTFYNRFVTPRITFIKLVWQSVCVIEKPVVRTGVNGADARGVPLLNKGIGTAQQFILNTQRQVTVHVKRQKTLPYLLIEEPIRCKI